MPMTGSRSLGNQAMQRALRGHLLQARLTINQPGDRYEQEADRVADTVMRMPNPQVASTLNITPLGRHPVQRCSCGGSSSGGQCEACQAKEQAMQRKGTGATSVQTAPAIVDQVLRSPGHALDVESRSFMESRLGRDFSDVRIHTDSLATESAQAVNALAYTVGNRVVFGAQHYRPSTNDGRRLLAHELVHVMQQDSGSRPKTLTNSIKAEHTANGEPTSTQQRAVRVGAAPTSIQRLGDLAARPATLTCPLPTTSTGNVVTNVLFGLDSSRLTPTGVADVASFIASWNAAGTNPPVRVDGFASTDGAQSLNWTLSCNRAEAVVNELTHPSGGGSGIPSGSIDKFAQGATSEFSATSLEQNRRATISANLAAPPPPPTCKNPGVARSLDLQPVFLRTDPTDATPTGTSWTRRFNESNNIWGKVGVTFVDLGPVTVDTPLKSSGTTRAERTSIRALRSGAGVEVFLVDNDVTAAGGADTLPPIGAGCGANGNIVLSDRGTSDTLLAHELGHILGLDHPTDRPPFNPGEANTIMEPSRSNSTPNPTRNTMTNFNKILCPPGTGSTCLNPDS